VNKGKLYSVITVIILFLCGCAGLNYNFIKDNLDNDIDEGHYIDGLHFFGQEKNFCGPAALAIVMNYWGDDVSQEEIAQEIYRPSIKGSLTVDLERYAFKRGFFAQAGIFELDELGPKIRDGIPVVVMLQVMPFIKKNHYLVFFGYDETREVVLVYSGKDEPELMGYGDFVRKWESAGKWALIVCPPQKVNWDLDAYYLNKLGLIYEESGVNDLAVIYYKKAVKEDDSQALYFFNLGNVYLKLKDYTQAVVYYIKAIEIDKGYADAYNNIAYSLYLDGRNLDMAEDYAKEALALPSDKKAYYYDTLGLIYLKRKDFKKARETFKQALREAQNLDTQVQDAIKTHLESIPQD
jgi:tetratricopeptide (TPR) repeat protein